MPESFEKRLKRLMPDGKPRYVRCYEAKRHPGADPYCIVFTRANTRRVEYVSSSAYPFHPQGVYMHGEADRWSFRPGGSRISFDELPKDVQKAVIQDYKDWWKLNKA